MLIGNTGLDHDSLKVKTTDLAKVASLTSLFCYQFLPFGQLTQSGNENLNPWILLTTVKSLVRHVGEEIIPECQGLC
jgi:hypothetical protein